MTQHPKIIMELSKAQMCLVEAAKWAAFERESQVHTDIGKIKEAIYQLQLNVMSRCILDAHANGKLV